MQVIDNSTNQETALDSLFTFLLRFIHARLMGVCQSTNQETVLSHIESTYNVIGFPSRDHVW